MGHRWARCSPILWSGLAPKHQLSTPLGVPRLLSSACPALSPPPTPPVPISRAAPPPPFPPKTQDQSPTTPHVLLHQGHQSGLPEIQLGPCGPLPETSLKSLLLSLTPETAQNSPRSRAPCFLHSPQTLLSLTLRLCCSFYLERHPSSESQTKPPFLWKILCSDLSRLAIATGGSGSRPRPQGEEECARHGQGQERVPHRQQDMPRARGEKGLGDF